jgi:sugar (pentulose or hexulose) kinase
MSLDCLNSCHLPTGKSFRWFVDTFCPPFEESPEQVKAAFDSLVLQAAQVEVGSGGLLFFPYLLGERTLGNAHSRASFGGATLRHGRAHSRGRSWRG